MTTGKQQRALLGALSAVTILIATLILAISLAPSPAAAETPAQRCQRETAAYNNAWKAIGKKPPAPYKCGSSNEPPPTLSPSTPEEGPSKTAEPSEESPKNDSGSGPSMNAPTERRELEHPDQGQVVIVPGPESSEKTRIAPFESLLKPGQSLAELRQEAVALVNRLMKRPNPIASFNQIGYRDRNLVLNATTLDHLKVNVDRRTPPPRACMRDGARGEAISMAGNTIYTYWHDIEKCGVSGVDVTARIIASGGETSTPTWSHVGKAFDNVVYKAPGVGTQTTVITGEKFEQKVVFSGIGSGVKTVCLRGKLDKWGNYDTDQACNLG